MVKSLRNFLHVTGAVAWSSSDENAIRYILPVSWMTSCLSIIVDAKATPVRRILEVTHQEATRDEIMMFMTALLLL